MTDTSRTTFASIYPPDEAWLARAAPEPAIEPDLPIVDTHLHLWESGGHRYFLDEYVRDLAESGHRVEASVFVECFSMYRAEGPAHLRHVGETEFAVGMAAMAASGRYTTSRVAAAIVGHTDLRQGPRAREALEAHVEAANGRFRGIRQRAKWDADPVVKGRYSADEPGLYLDPAFGEGLEALTALGLSFDASIYHPQMPDVVALARAHPAASIILDHCGSPVGHASYRGHEAENHATWLRGMRELARFPNVSVKLGGLLMNLANYDFAALEAPLPSDRLAELWRPWIEPCVELFGAGRCMVSSNFPVDKAGLGYGAVWNVFKRVTQGCSAEEKALIYAGTAKRIYRIP
jgi:L-fuconolactonase